METIEIVGLSVAFMLLALVVLPGPFRRGALFLLHGGVNLAILCAVIACAVFAFKPQYAPLRLTEILATAPGGNFGIRWLLTAVCLVAVGLPVAIGLEHAREKALDARDRRRQRRMGDVQPNDEHQDHVPANGTPNSNDTPRPCGSNVAAAINAIRAATGTAKNASSLPLVKDMFKSR